MRVLSNKIKICIICNIGKPISEFYKRKDRKGNETYRNDCKECHNKKGKENYKENKDDYLATNKKYRDEHKKEILKQKKKYYEDNKDILLEKQKEYRKEHPEIFKAQQKRRVVDGRKKISDKKYYEGNKQKFYEAWLEQSQTLEYKLKHRQRNHKRRAKYKETDITFEWIWELHENTPNCVLCGVELTEGNDKDSSRHLDHIVLLSLDGTHTMDNVRYICKKCNLKRPKDGSDIKENTKEELMVA